MSSISSSLMTGASKHTSANSAKCFRPQRTFIFSALVEFPLILPALPAAADWERLRPQTESPPRIPPAADAVCREKARSIGERIRQAQAAAAAAGREVELWITHDTWADRQWFWRRCFQPPCVWPPMSRGRRLLDRTVTGPYERLLRLCGKQEEQR